MVEKVSSSHENQGSKLTNEPEKKNEVKFQEYSALCPTYRTFARKEDAGT